MPDYKRKKRSRFSQKPKTDKKRFTEKEDKKKKTEIEDIDEKPRKRRTFAVIIPVITPSKTAFKKPDNMLRTDEKIVS